MDRTAVAKELVNLAKEISSECDVVKEVRAESFAPRDAIIALKN